MDSLSVSHFCFMCDFKRVFPEFTPFSKISETSDPLPQTKRVGKGVERRKKKGRGESGGGGVSLQGFKAYSTSHFLQNFISFHISFNFTFHRIFDL